MPVPLPNLTAAPSAEFDYRHESANLLEIGNNMRRHFGARVIVPKPLTHLCTQNVLVTPTPYTPSPWPEPEAPTHAQSPQPPPRNPTTLDKTLG